MMENVNLWRGLIRLWIVGSLMWVVCLTGYALINCSTLPSGYSSISLYCPSSTGRAHYFADDIAVIVFSGPLAALIGSSIIIWAVLWVLRGFKPK